MRSDCPEVNMSIASPPSPQMRRWLNQRPISYVAVRPRWKGGRAVPVVPKHEWAMTTPSVAAGPPGNWA
ncbi:hypothetical protein QR64_22675 [Rhodococcus sp. Chr-9]|nr:hypothetical protein QR64_22675 [Rhodococcus sp. Chr-9]